MKPLSSYPDAHLRIFDRPEVPDHSSIDDVYLIGICGTGMGSLAALFAEAGFSVRGSDQEAWPPMSDRLAELGIPVVEGYDASNLEPEPDLVIVGNACTPTHPEAAYARENGLVQQSFPEALAHFFISDRRSIVVAGTHGKTSTTGLLVHLFEDAHLQPGYMIGGVRIGTDRSQSVGSGRYFISEGDEYDSAYFDKRPKFFHYQPQVAVVTSVEFDHADIYDSPEEYADTFRQFADIVDPDGCLVLWGDDPAVWSLRQFARCDVLTYGAQPHNDVTVEQYAIHRHGESFELLYRGGSLGKVQIPTWGQHNLLNALAAASVAIYEGLGIEQVKSSLADFKGMKRRQEVRGEIGGVTVVDDFAHHPTAVRYTIEGTKNRWPGRRVVAVFEPRSNSSRRKIFESDYIRALSMADAVFLSAPPLRHNDRPEDFLDAESVIASIRENETGAHLADTPEALLTPLLQTVERGDIVLIMSNGSIGGLHEKLLTSLSTESTAK